MALLLSCRAISIGHFCFFFFFNGIADGLGARFMLGTSYAFFGLFCMARFSLQCLGPCGRSNDGSAHLGFESYRLRLELGPTVLKFEFSQKLGWVGWVGFTHLCFCEGSCYKEREGCGTVSQQDHKNLYGCESKVGLSFGPKP